MTRKERRAAEHQPGKPTAKLASPNLNRSEPEPSPPSSQSPNPKKKSPKPNSLPTRANAQHSTGPSPASFVKISQNALKHGLTGRAVVLPGEDAALYEARMLALSKRNSNPSAPKRQNSSNPSLTYAGVSAASPVSNPPRSS